MLEARPDAGMPLYGIARTYELEGNRRLEKPAYDKFLAAWQSADTDLEQVSRARERRKAL